MATTTQAAERYSGAIERARFWLVKSQRKDGSYGPEACNLVALETSAIWLALTGHSDRACRLLRYVKHTLLQADGSFRQRRVEGLLSEWIYAPSWTVVGAHLNSFFEISQPAMDHILLYQDSKTGGMFGHPASQRAGAGTIVPSITAVAGTAALQTGRTAEARRMGDFFLRLLASQPDLDSRFYPFYHTGTGRVIEGTSELAPTYAPAVAPLSPFERDKPGQHYWLLGFMMAFLSDLYRATGEKEYLDSAKTVFDFGQGCHADLYQHTMSHKYLWGCTRLYHASGDSRHLQPALRIADFLVKVQETDGTWWNSGFIPERSAQTPGLTVDVTSQFCIWLVRLLEVI